MATYNLKNPAVKRILQEIKEVQADTSGDFLAEALENDIFEWHFVIRGPADSEFEGGVYHGRILLPAEYPFKPPAFMMLTPSGRFETGVKICLSISAHHPEHWQPSWSVRTALTALIAFMPSPGAGALGSLDYTKEERRKLAAKSRMEAPKWGSGERQKMIDDMHARMLALTPQPQPQTSQGTVTAAAAGPALEPAAQAAEVCRTTVDASDTGNVHSDVVNKQGNGKATSAAVMVVKNSPQASPAHGSATAASVAHTPQGVQRSPLRPPVPCTSHAATTSPTQQSRQDPSSCSAVAATPPSAPLAPHSQAPSCVKHRDGSTAPNSAPHTPTVSRHAHAAASPPTAPRTATAVHIAPAPAPPPPDTWTLTALAVALGVLIAAILLRKALVAVGYDLPPLTGLGASTAANP